MSRSRPIHGPEVVAGARHRGGRSPERSRSEPVTISRLIGIAPNQMPTSVCRVGIFIVGCAPCSSVRTDMSSRISTNSSGTSHSAAKIGGMRVKCEPERPYNGMRMDGRPIRGRVDEPR